MPKFKTEFEGFDTALLRLEVIGGNVNATTEKALKECHRQVTEEARQAMSKHTDTGETMKSLDTSGTVKWSGSVATVHVGFNISDGGLPSIFHMYGTPRHNGANQYGRNGGQINGIPQDKALWNALAYKSKSLQNKVHKIQKEIFDEEIKKFGGES